MKINGPFATLPLDLSCVDKAGRLNDITHLHELFDESELILATSNEIHNYFLEFSNYEITYDLQALSQTLSKHHGSLFNNDNDFKLSLKMHLPKSVWTELAKLLQLEISRCFKQVFTLQGDLQSWLKDIFIDNQLAELYQQFGEVNVKFEMFHIFALHRLELFEQYVSPADKDCSTMLIELTKAELLAYKDLSSSLAHLETTLNNLDDSYKNKERIKQIYQQADKFFFSNKFLAQESIKECIEQICNIVISQEPLELIYKLQSKAALLTAKTNNKYLHQFVSSISVFIGAFLIVAGLINAPIISPFLAAGLITSGFTLFGGGIKLFKNSASEKFSEKVEGFANQAQEIELNYLGSLAK